MRFLSEIDGADKVKQDTQNRFVTDAEKANWNTAESNVKNYVDEKVKTDVPANAKFTDTIYTHPSMHPASIITESTSRRFVSDTEIGQWNEKTKTITSPTEPSLETGDQWHKEI